MDDLAIPLTAKHNDQLIQNVKLATGLILDTLRVHAITPNLQKGKAELLVHPKGPGTQALRHSSATYLALTVLANLISWESMAPTLCQW